MNFAYSATSDAFYDVSLKDVYQGNGNWPDDCKDVPDEIFMEFRTGTNSEGKVRGSGSDGLPAWFDAPPMSNEALISVAADKKKTLMQAATLEISPLQDAEDLGIATDEEKSLLTSWKEYRVALNRIESQPSYPEEIQWPSSPGDI